MLTAGYAGAKIPPKNFEGICMRGRIFTDQKCPLCGGNFVHDGHRGGLFCLKHPDQQATGRFRVQFGRDTRKRFSVYREAERFLTGLRWEIDQGTYDPRDYRVDHPWDLNPLPENGWRSRRKRSNQSLSIIFEII